MGPLKIRSLLGRRAWRNIFLIAGICLLLLILVLRFSIAPFLKHELVDAVQKHLNARLTIGDLSYSMPYGVVARDCHFIALMPDGESELLSVAELDLRLGELPLPGKPLIVEDLVIKSPDVHLVKTRDGYLGQNGLIRPESISSDSTPNNQKFSDLLRLRHIGVQDAQVIYEDLTRNVPKTVWTKLNFEIGTSPEGVADYGFNILANSLAAADVEADGSFNVDELTTVLKHFSLKLQAGSDETKHLPPEIQQVLAHYRVRGKLSLDGSARGDLNHPEQNSFSAKLSLQDASAYSPESSLGLDDLHLSVLSAADWQGASVLLTDFSATSGAALLTVHPGLKVSLDHSSWKWTLENLDILLARSEKDASQPLATQENPDRLNLTGSAELTASFKGPIDRSADLKDIAGEAQLSFRKLSVQPPKFPLAVSEIDGPPIEFTKGGYIRCHNFVAHYGNDQLALSSLLLDIRQLRAGIVRVPNVSGKLLFNARGSKYPEPVNQIFKMVQPGGVFVFKGTGSYDRARRKNPLDYHALLNCDNATLSVFQPRFNIFQIHFDSEAFIDHAEVSSFSCKTLDGRLTMQGKVDMQPPYAYSGVLFIDRVSLPKVVALALPPDKQSTDIQGQLDVHTSISGSAPAAGKSAVDSIKAQGQFELYGSDLWDIPALEKIAGDSGFARSALTIGEAAALFRVQDHVIELQDAVVSAPALGVQGHGTIDFDGTLDLHAIAAPLGDWRKKLEGGFLGTGFADAMGTVQDTLNKASEHLLYQFHVYGPAANPILKTEAAPDLQDRSAESVTTMLKHSDSDRPLTLLDQSKQK